MLQFLTVHSHRGRVPRRVLPRTAALALTLAFAASAWGGDALKPAHPPTAHEAHALMRARLDALPGFALATRLTPANALTGEPYTVVEATILRRGEKFSMETRIVGQQHPTLPPRWFLLFDGRHFFNHAPGRFEAMRTDLAPLTPPARAMVLQTSTPPLLPELPPGKGTLTQETIDRRLYNVIRAEGLDDRCHGIRKFTLWIDALTDLPHRLEADFRGDIMRGTETLSGASMTMQPVFAVIEYLDWRLDVLPPDSRFGFVAPDNVRLVDKEAPEFDPNCLDCPDEPLLKAQIRISEALREEGAPVPLAP